MSVTTPPSGVRRFAVDAPRVLEMRFAAADRPDEGLFISEVYTVPLWLRAVDVLNAAGLGIDHVTLVGMSQRFTGPFADEAAITRLPVEPSLLKLLSQILDSGWEPDLSRVRVYGGAPAPFREVIAALRALLADARDRGVDFECETM